MTAFSGVRNSWLTVARKSALLLSATSALILASSSAASRAFSSVTSVQIVTEPPSVVLRSLTCIHRPSLRTIS